jgi:hypothetical protein
MNAAELTRAMLEAKRHLEETELEHRRCVAELATADRALRIAESVAYLATAGTVGERDALTKKATADERYRFKLADGLERSALEAIRNGRQILSSLQSLAAAQREEAHLARYMDRELEPA